MIPTYDALMLPVLELVAQQDWKMADLVNRLADDLRLTAEERAETIPSGGFPLIANRVHWAKTYLKKAGLLAQPSRGVVAITESGRDLLRKTPKKIDIKLLKQFPEFTSFVTRKDVGSDGDEKLRASGESQPSAEGANGPNPTGATPDEQISSAASALNLATREGLLARILELSPAFFERLIIDVLLAMGYGGSRDDAGRQLGGSGDGGVDGVISEDRLGLDRVFLQAKRYDPSSIVGPAAIQAFIGALVGKGANKGVFITTSSFTKAAREAANQSGNTRIVLIDGDALTRYMMEFNVGVRVDRVIEIKRVDPSYFETAIPE